MKGINFRDKLIAFILNNFTGIENEKNLVLTKVILSIQNAITAKKNLFKRKLFLHFVAPRSRAATRSLLPETLL